jgi:hypothetical protein
MKLILFLLCAVSCAAQGLLATPPLFSTQVVQAQNCIVTPCTLASNVTIGNSLGVIISVGTLAPVQIGSQTLLQQGSTVIDAGTTSTTAFAASPVTVSSNSVTCTSCSLINYIFAVEFSGVNGIEPVIGCFGPEATCQVNSAGVLLDLQYNPGYSTEGVMFGYTCSGSAGAPKLIGLRGGGLANPSGNSIGWGISSNTTSTGLLSTTACGNSSAIGLAFIGTGSERQPTVNPNQSENSTIATSPTTTATVAATILNVGDLVTFEPWCLPSCGGTIIMGSQTATCPASTQGSSNASAGQPGICYIIATSSGIQTVTFTPSGGPTQFQIAYHDFTVSANSNVAFDQGAVTNCTGSCFEGTNVVLPSITPTHTGSFLLNYVSTLNHVVGPATGSPKWSCYGYIGTGDNHNCNMLTTQNGVVWILSSASGSTTANMTILTNDDTYESVIAAFQVY